MNKHALLLIRLAAFTVLLGRAWQHLFWDAPFRTLFWDESLLSPIVEGVFGIPWDTYATSPMTDALIRKLIASFGFLYLLGAIVCLLPTEVLRSSKISRLLPISSLGLLLLAFLYSKDRFYQVGQGIEYAAQFLAPLFLYYAVQKNEFSKRTILLMKLAIFCTFFGHGLYAIGYYHVPGGFIDMVINVLGVDQDQAVRLLFWAGVLDFAVAIGIFIPRMENAALFYCVIWGLLTSFARVAANFDSTVPWETLSQWTPEVIMRLPHAALPLALLYIVNENQSEFKKRISALRFSTLRFL